LGESFKEGPIIYLIFCSFFLSRKLKLMVLNTKFEDSLVSKPPSEEIATQAFLNKAAQDPAQRNGVGAIGTFENVVECQLQGVLPYFTIAQSTEISVGNMLTKQIIRHHHSRG
jgi:hypothetical protein